MQPCKRRFQRPEPRWKTSGPVEKGDPHTRVRGREEARARWVSPFYTPGPPAQPAPAAHASGRKRAPKVLH